MDDSIKNNASGVSPENIAAAVRLQIWGPRAVMALIISGACGALIAFSPLSPSLAAAAEAVLAFSAGTGAATLVNRALLAKRRRLMAGAELTDWDELGARVAAKSTLGKSLLPAWVDKTLTQLPVPALQITQEINECLSGTALSAKFKTLEARQDTLAPVNDDDAKKLEISKAQLRGPKSP